MEAGNRLQSEEPSVAEWRNWQTQRTQNPSKFTLREGSTPSSATNSTFIVFASALDRVARALLIAESLSQL
jgi:hypothetical protein